MPKLTLRELFAVITIVALALGWWVDRTNQARKAVHWESQAMKALNWVHDYSADVAIGMDPDKKFTFVRISKSAHDQPNHSK